MDVEERMPRLAEISELITELFDTNLTLIVINSELGMESVSCGFDPEQNPEALDLLLAVVLGMAQGAIDQCGKDYEIFVRQDSVMRNYSEVIGRLEKELKSKIH